LEAESFDTLLSKALSQNYSLKSDNINIQKEIIRGDISTRWDNPQLELELSRFDESLGDMGFRTSVTQSIPLPSIQRDREILSTKEVELKRANYRLNRAKYIKNLSLLYVDYVGRSNLYKSSLDETKIAKDIYALVEAREGAGSVSRGELLRARVDYDMAMESKDSVGLSETKSYYRLLKYANISKNIDISTSYKFKVIHRNTHNPTINLLKSSQSRDIAKSNLESHIIKSVGLFGEYEEDRGEGVVRLGVSIPLGINDRKDEEIQLSKLESKQNLLKLDRERIRLEITLNELRDEAKALDRLKDKNQKILSDEKILLEKFQEAYRIATINLIELQEVKNRLIQTQNRLIKIEMAKSQNTIEQNYILGVYND
jgi:cobalt-zinc-cadmium efflux system outer membrane protein